jgi:hypothetical protein
MIDSNALRMTFLIIGLMVLLGIWLTGFNVVHWLLYVPTAFLIFAGLTGICPGLIVNKLILKEK